MHSRGNRFLDFFGFSILTTEFGLSKEFKDPSRKRVFLYFFVVLPKRELASLNREQKFSPGNTVGVYGHKST
jgi:hypothetical protein